MNAYQKGVPKCYIHIRKWENQSFEHSMFFVSLDSVGTTMSSKIG